jgi:hypothetical protein
VRAENKIREMGSFLSFRKGLNYLIPIAIKNKKIFQLAFLQECPA